MSDIKLMNDNHINTFLVGEAFMRDEMTLVKHLKNFFIMS